MAPAVEEQGHHNFTGTPKDSFGVLWRGELRCYIASFAVCFRAQNGGTTFRPLWRYVTERHTLPRGTAANGSDMQPFCQ